MTLIDTFRTRMRKRSQYRQTRYEIANMPLDVALDLGIFREDAAKIASKAVYG